MKPLQGDVQDSGRASVVHVRPNDARNADSARSLVAAGALCSFNAHPGPPPNLREP